MGDDGTFRRWYEMAAPRVYAYVYSRTGSRELAEELTQETFIEVVRHPGNHDGRAELLPWTIGIARHRIAHHFRAHRRDEQRSRHVVGEIDLRDAGEQPWRRVEARQDVAEVLDLLPAAQRAVLMLRFVDDLAVRDVARVIGRSEDATESLLRRARQAFEAAYRERDDAV